MAQEQGLLGGRYRLAVTVGRGGMGTVWRAHDEMLGRDVAVKEVLLPPGLGDAERRVLYERTFREARASARLTHPNVVTVHDVVEEDGRPWIVMEYVPARSLQDIIDQDGPVDPRTAADIGRQTLLALRHAHNAGILHRDVKPSNVLITDEGRAVLTDFGIAQMEGDANLTQTGLVMGSPAYIPPERAKGERAVPASDLWSLGATLYAAVEGKAPYERSDAIAALAASLTEPVPPPRNAGALAPVLDGLLAREPRLRMTADQALPALKRVGAEPGRTQPDQGPALAATPAPAAATPATPAAAGAADMDVTRLDGSSWDAPTTIDPPRPAVARSGFEAGPRTAPPPYTSPSAPPYTSPPVAAPARRPEVRPVGGPADQPDPTWVLHHDAGRHDAGQRGPAHPQAHPQDYAGQWHDAGLRPVTQPGQGSRPGGRRPVRTTLIVVLVILAAAVGGALIAQAGSWGAAGDDNTPFDEYTARKSTGSTSPAIATKTWLGDGFSVKAPVGWTFQEQNTRVIWLSADKSRRLEVDWTEWSGTPAAEAGKADKKGRTNPAFPGYRSEGVTELVYQGQPSAEWEFTYNDSAKTRRLHAIDRWFTLGDTPYAIYFRAPDEDWSTARSTFDTAISSFRER